MRNVCERSVASGVAIGAQVGYRDLPGFGRRFIDIEPEALTQDVIYQIGAHAGLPPAGELIEIPVTYDGVGPGRRRRRCWAATSRGRTPAHR